jgi:hypothetical protein
MNAFEHSYSIRVCFGPEEPVFIRFHFATLILTGNLALHYIFVLFASMFSEEVKTKHGPTLE